MILVTGTTGKLGYLVAKALEQENVNMRLLVRDKDKAPTINKSEVVEGDYGDPESLDRAFAGIERAFIVSLHMPPMERATLHRNAFEAAAKAGVEFIVYTSFQGAAEDATFSMALDHAQSELYLRQTGLTYAALRNSFYTDTAHEEVNQGKILNPAGDGNVNWVCREDIAQVAAHLLLNPLTQSEAFDVTGPEALKLSDLAALFAELTGKDIRFETESHDEGLARRKAFGLSDWNLDAWMSADLAKGRGENAAVSSTVERFLGRNAMSVKEFYQKNLHLLDDI